MSGYSGVSHPKLYVLSSTGDAPLRALAQMQRLTWHGGWTAAGWLGVIYPQSHLCKCCLAKAGAQTISAYNPSALPSGVIAALQKAAPAVATGDTAWAAATKLLGALGAGWEFLDPEV